MSPCVAHYVASPWYCSNVISLNGHCARFSAWPVYACVLVYASASIDLDLEKVISHCLICCSLLSQTWVYRSATGLIVRGTINPNATETALYKQSTRLATSQALHILLLAMLSAFLAPFTIFKSSKRPNTLNQIVAMAIWQISDFCLDSN